MSELNDLRKVEHTVRVKITKLEADLDWYRNCEVLVDEAIQRKLMDSLDQKREVNNETD